MQQRNCLTDSDMPDIVISEFIDLDAASASHFAATPNLILTPHIAGVTEESNVRVSAVTAQSVLRHLMT